MSRNNRMNKENRKNRIAKNIVQMDEVPDEEVENSLTVCSPLKAAETSDEYFQISMNKNDSRICQPDIQVSYIIVYFRHLN